MIYFPFSNFKQISFSIFSFSSFRTKRNSAEDEIWVEKIVSPRIIADSEGRDLQVITLDCDRGTAKCLDIRCDVYNLPVQVPATVEVRARLWNSTLLEDYPKIGMFAFLQLLNFD